MAKKDGRSRPLSMGEIARAVVKTTKSVVAEELRPLQAAVTGMLERERTGLDEMRDIVADRVAGPTAVRNETRVTQGVLLGELHTDIDALEKSLAALWDRLTPVVAQQPKAVDTAAPGGPTTTTTPIAPLALSSHAQGIQHATYRLRHIAAQVQNLTGLLEL